MKNFDEAQRAYDNMTPEDPAECPICGAALEKDGDGWICTNEECKWAAYPDFGGE